ncbi:MAG: SMC-Scp complex subunit ScpB [Candidatus Bathyarchaeia archaeon]
MESDKRDRDVERIALIEAALYAAGRPVELEKLAKMAGTKSEKVALRLIGALARRYEEGESALEVKELPGARFVLQLKPDYTKTVRSLASRPLLTKGPLKTLSYIAYYQPVGQGKVLEDRGRHVYSHLKMLDEMGLISREKANEKGTIIKTTPYFADYFGFSHNPNRSKVQLRRLFEQLKIQKIENLKNNGLNNGVKNQETILAEKEILRPSESLSKPQEPLVPPPDSDNSK